jgi:hypothetical protein
MRLPESPQRPFLAVRPRRADDPIPGRFHKSVRPDALAAYSEAVHRPITAATEDETRQGYRHEVLWEILECRSEHFPGTGGLWRSLHPDGPWSPFWPLLYSTAARRPGRRTPSDPSPVRHGRAVPERRSPGLSAPSCPGLCTDGQVRWCRVVVSGRLVACPSMRTSVGSVVPGHLGMPHYAGGCSASLAVMVLLYGFDGRASSVSACMPYPATPSRVVRHLGSFNGRVGEQTLVLRRQ